VKTRGGAADLGESPMSVQAGGQDLSSPPVAGLAAPKGHTHSTKLAPQWQPTSSAVAWHRGVVGPGPLHAGRIALHSDCSRSASYARLQLMPALARGGIEARFSTSNCLAFTPAAHGVGHCSRLAQPRCGQALVPSLPEPD
jgi:hypothetical protein